MTGRYVAIRVRAYNALTGGRYDHGHHWPVEIADIRLALICAALNHQGYVISSIDY